MGIWPRNTLWFSLPSIFINGNVKEKGKKRKARIIFASPAYFAGIHKLSSMLQEVGLLLLSKRPFCTWDYLKTVA